MSIHVEKLGKDTLNSAGSLDNLVVEVDFEGIGPKTANIIYYQKSLKFKCQRCASLCCRLGGPPLTEKDVERIFLAGYPLAEFSEPVQHGRFRLSKDMQGAMRNREDGSCIFLKFDTEGNKYECSIYDYRPALCRLYPFFIEKLSSGHFLLKVIPCCRGADDPKGDPVNRKFILNVLHESIVDLVRDWPP